MKKALSDHNRRIGPVVVSKCASVISPAAISTHLGNAICRRCNAERERAVTLQAESARDIINFVAGKKDEYCFDMVDTLADFLAKSKWGLYTEWT